MIDPDENDHALDPSRRAFLQATGVSLAALSRPRKLWAAQSGPDSSSPTTPIDFRYSPAQWQTLICLPDDSDKPLVGKEGQLLFDFGVIPDGELASGRGYALVLQPDLAGGTHWRRQTTVTPRVPIVQTLKEANGIEVTEEIFVVVPEPHSPAASPRMAQVDITNFMYGWTTPLSACSPAFSNGLASGLGKPIHFQVAVTPGAQMTVVYGLCEGLFSKPGERLLTLSAEGGGTKTVDPVKDFGANHPGIYKWVARDANHDGKIDIYVDVPPNADRQSPAGQAVLNALWIFTGDAPPDEAIIAGRADDLAYAAFPAIFQPPRRALVRMTFRNTTRAATTCRPLLRVRSVYAVTRNETTQAILVGNGTRIVGSTPLSLSRTGAHNEYVVQMFEITLPPGESSEAVFTVERHLAESAGVVNPARARALRAAAFQWWQDYDLPYSAIEVPDRDIQSMLESCMRNIWQARELKIGGPAFEVGPTWYRGLWIADGSFILETATLLGRGRDARAGLEYMLSRQKRDGGFEEMPHYWKENGLMLWAATRHALLMQDKEWLRSHWPALRRVMANIRHLREQASKNPRALNYRLLPPGFVDGGLYDTGDPEFSNTQWTLSGMHAVIRAAHWLGEQEDATAWQQQYEDFYAVFRAACARDTLTDEHGNAYVPVMMANAGNHVPQKGQWAFCHAVYPGQIFAKDDALVAGQLAMLRDTDVEGLVCDTGGVEHGLWGYFASFYGHAQLWVGNSREAVRSLYAFANHACPTRVWVEEQLPLGQDIDGTKAGGDMPHNWGSAEFIRLTAHLIQLDRGDELHLLEGFPREWAGRGMVTRLNGVSTPFGLLHIEVRIAGDGASAKLKMNRLSGRTPSKILLHLDGLTGKSEVIALPTDRNVAIDCPLSL